MLYKIHTLKPLWWAIGKVQINKVRTWQLVINTKVQYVLFEKYTFFYSPMTDTVSSSGKGCWSFKFTKDKKFLKLIAFWFSPYISYSSYKFFVISLKCINVHMCNMDKYLWEQQVLKYTQTFWSNWISFSNFFYNRAIIVLFGVFLYVKLYRLLLYVL